MRSNISADPRILCICLSFVLIVSFDRCKLIVNVAINFVLCSVWMISLLLFLVNHDDSSLVHIIKITLTCSNILNCRVVLVLK